MKVAALVVLIIAVTGLEAGVVKREVPNIEKLTEYFQSLADTFKTQTQEIFEKIKSGEVQTQAGQYLEQAKSQAEPLAAQWQKLFADFAEQAKKAIGN
ncbi:apolipoprotein A-II [Discoglossus pictus]